MKYKVGDYVWIVVHRFAIRCRIDDVQYTDELSGEIPSYWIDEPIGHGMDEDELFDSKKEAIDYAKQLILPKGTNDLIRWRFDSYAWISSTHGTIPTEEEIKKTISCYYPAKFHGKEWIVLKQRKHSLIEGD